MAWIYLLLAGMCEMVWPLGFKYTHGFSTRYWAVALTFGILLLSLWLLSQATTKGIAMGTAYAIWTGVGATGTAIIGMLFFNESKDLLRIGCLTLIILGVVGLKLLSPPEATPATSPTEQPAGEYP